MTEAKYCSFCGKISGKIRFLIAGPEVAICNECLDICIQIAKDIEAPGNVEYDSWGKSSLI